MTGNSIEITSPKLQTSPFKTTSKRITLIFTHINKETIKIDDIKTSNGKISNFQKTPSLSFGLITISPSTYTATFKTYNPGMCTVAVLNSADKKTVMGDLSWEFSTLSSITPALCDCDVGLTAGIGVDLIYSPKTYPININLDKYLQKITTSTFCKKPCPKKTVSNTVCKKVEKKFCKAFGCLFDSTKLVCNNVNTIETISSSDCSVLDGAKTVACENLQNLEKNLQIEIKGEFKPFTQSTIEATATTDSVGGDISVGAGLAFLINNITIKVKDELPIDTPYPFGKNPIIIDCEAVVGTGLTAYADCAICQQFPSPGGFTINEDGLKDTFGNMMWSICYAAGTEDGFILDISGHASISYSIDSAVVIDVSERISLGIDIPLG